MIMTVAVMSGRHMECKGFNPYPFNGSFSSKVKLHVAVAVTVKLGETSKNHKNEIVKLAKISSKHCCTFPGAAAFTKK